MIKGPPSMHQNKGNAVAKSQVVEILVVTQNAESGNCRNRATVSANWRTFYSTESTETGWTLGLAKPDRPVTRVDRQRLPATVHFPVDLRFAEAAFHGHRNPQADVPVVRAGVDIRLQVGG